MNSLTRCQPLLGTYVEVQITGSVSDETLINISQDAFSAISNVHDSMSFQSLDSELTRLNLSAVNRSVTVSNEFYEVLSASRELSEITNGLFDVTVARKLVEKGVLPDHGFKIDPLANWQHIKLLPENSVIFERPLVIDLSGIAKGFAVDQAIEAINKYLATYPDLKACVNAGGDLRMTHWQNEVVGVRSPTNQGLTIDMAMQRAALATSANYFLDGETVIVKSAGRRSDLGSKDNVSVFAPTCMLADGLTKVAYLWHSSDEQNPIAGLNNVICQLGASAIQVVENKICAV